MNYKDDGSTVGGMITVALCLLCLYVGYTIRDRGDAHCTDENGCQWTIAGMNVQEVHFTSFWQIGCPASKELIFV